MTAATTLRILPQPDDVTCGPTCLQAVYAFHGDAVPIADVIREVEPLETRGTLGAYLGRHALERGYGATLYTYNLEVFDPSWFRPGVDLRAKLEAQAIVKDRPRLRVASRAYQRFIEHGGRVEHRELNPELIVEQLDRRRPVLTGLSATYLYGCAREVDDGPRLYYDDLRGEPTGHFVVVYGHRPETGEVLVADPLMGNPLGGMGGGHHYAVGIHRFLGAVMLGAMTYDGNLLVLDPPGSVG